jgi:hypothetical protein
MINLKKIRTLLKKVENRIISVNTLSYALKLDKKKAQETLILLEQQGYLQQWGEENYWNITIRGQVLVHRKFHKSFKPSTMQQHVDELIKRASTVNAAVRFPDYVVCMKITSEYPITVSGSGVVVAFALNTKNISEDEYERAANILRRDNNVTFGNHVEYIFYPHTAIQKFLKSGSHILKIRQFSIQDIQQLEGTIIFEDCVPE